MKFLSLIIILVIPINMYAGFIAGTPVVSSHDESRLIEYLKVDDYVDSWSDRGLENNKVIATQSLQQHCFAILLPENEVIVASHLQRFYVPSEGIWKSACHLQRNDFLLASNGDKVAILDVKEISDQSRCYDITVEKNHTFFISSHKILVHNFIPIAIGITFFIGGGALEFGGVSLALGCTALGGLIGAKLWRSSTLTHDMSILDWQGQSHTGCFANEGQVGSYNACVYPTDIPYSGLVLAIDKKSDQKSKTTDEQIDEDRLKGAQAPGKPLEEDGFYPPKNWNGKKVRHPKNDKVGWPDKDGKVWVPTGPEDSPLSHGGPHWDVQHPNGKDYDNVYPGGVIRPGRR